MKQYAFYLKIVVPIITIAICGVLFGIFQYENAKYCNSPTTVSRTCITKSNQQIVKIDHKIIDGGSGYGAGPEDDLYGIVIKHDGKNTTLWIKPFPKALKTQPQAEMLSWNNRYIGVIVNQKTWYSYYWEPGFIKYTSILWLVLVFVIFGLPQALKLLAKYRFKKYINLKKIDTCVQVSYIFLGIAAFFIVFVVVDAATRMSLLI